MKQNTLFLLLPLSLTAVGAKAQNSAVDANQIVQTVQKQCDQLQSAHAYYTETVNSTRDFNRIYNIKNDPNSIPESPTQSIEWASKGEKRYRALYETPTATNPKLKSVLSEDQVGVFDGKLQYDSQVIRNTGNGGMVNVNYRKQRTNFVSPLSFGYEVDTQALSAVMRDPSTKLEGTSSDPKLGTLLKFSTSIQTPREKKPMLFWLAPRLGYLAVRVEDATPGEDTDLSVAQLDQAKQVGSLWFPVRGKTSFYRIENGKPVLLVERAISVHNVTLNDAPDSLFQPLYLQWPGAVVRDDDANITWEIGAHGEKSVINQGDNTGMWLGWIFVGSLTTLLATIMGIAWRRKRRHPLPQHA